MHEIHPKIVTDENMRPVAVQIDYDDWLAIEQQLGLQRNAETPADLARFSGVLQWPEDAVAYQRRVREEWAR